MMLHHSTCQIKSQSTAGQEAKVFSDIGYSSGPSEHNNQGGFTAPTASVGIDYYGPPVAGFSAANYSG
jgi:hypothetical protein